MSKEIVLGRIPEHIRKAKPDSNWIPNAKIDDESWGIKLEEEKR